LRYDRKVLVEKAVPAAREIEVSVLGNEQPAASVAGEIVPANEFYDYSAKYESADSQLLIPARLEEAQQQLVQEYAVRAFQALDCEGLARVDFLLDGQSGQIYLNEVNTLPGFTQISM
jgi:D-alanine-D-alanine ligase